MLLLKAAVPFPLADIHTEAVQAALAKHKEQKMALPMPTKRRSTFVQSPADACTPPGEAVPDSVRIVPPNRGAAVLLVFLLVLSQGWEVTSVPGVLKDLRGGSLGISYVRSLDLDGPCGSSSGYSVVQMGWTEATFSPSHLFLMDNSCLDVINVYCSAHKRRVCSLLVSGQGPQRGPVELQDLSHPCHVLAAAESLDDMVSVTMHVQQISITLCFPAAGCTH